MRQRSYQLPQAFQTRNAEIEGRSLEDGWTYDRIGKQFNIIRDAAAAVLLSFLLQADIARLIRIGRRGSRDLNFDRGTRQRGAFWTLRS